MPSTLSSAPIAPKRGWVGLTREWIGLARVRQHSAESRVEVHYKHRDKPVAVMV